MGLRPPTPCLLRKKPFLVAIDEFLAGSRGDSQVNFLMASHPGTSGQERISYLIVVATFLCIPLETEFLYGPGPRPQAPGPGPGAWTQG